MCFYYYPTTLTPLQVRESFASPSTISFWNLSRFIALTEAAGFSATTYRLHFHTLFAQPVFLCVMALLGATFSLFYASRRGQAAFLVFLAIISGFMIYSLVAVIKALGASGVMPLVLSVWGPIFITGATGFGFLLYREE